MREIKFRFWNKSQNKMHDEIHSKDFQGETIVHEQGLNDFIGIASQIYVLMQYTGLLDKNGKEIYEGDIVSCYPNINKPTQENRILKVLREADGQWISGTKFLHEMKISQFHSRIFSLQRKGYNIEASEERDDYGFVSYRLLQVDHQMQLI